MNDVGPAADPHLVRTTGMRLLLACSSVDGGMTDGDDRRLSYSA